MLVPIRIDRTRKPPIGTSLRSDGHWSVQGLVGAWAFNEGAGATIWNAVNSTIASVSGTPLWGAEGAVSSQTALGYYGYTGIPLKYNFTAFCTVKLTTAANNPLFDCGGNEGYRARVNSTGSITFYDYSVGTSLYTPTSVIALNSISNIVITGNQSGSSIYVRGVLKATNSIAYNGGIPSATSYISRSGQDGVTLNGTTLLHLLYNVSLSPTQVASLSANPWQIYEPELVWIEVPDGTGGTAYTSSADAGTVTLTGSATTNYHAYVSSADTGSVTLTGSTTSDYRGLVSHADTGTVTITGNAATDYRGLVSHAGAGSVILAGSTSTDYRNLVSSADTSTVTLTGYAAMDTITGAGSYTSNAEAGSITLSGVTTTNYRTLISGAGTGAVTVTGFTATDTVTAAGAYTSEAAAGTILLTGLPVTSHRSSVADSSAIQIVGSDATGYFGFTSGAEPSAVIITGAETSVLRTWISDAIPGSIVIHGYETSGISPIYEISKIFATARLSGPSATGRITTPTTGIRLT